MDSVLQNLGNKATNTTTGSSNNPPEQQQQNHQQTNRKSSPTDLLSDAKVVAEAAQSALKHDTSKIEKERVARAAENILDSAQQYGKLDEKGMGKYVDKAEEYLHKYNNSSGHGGTGIAAAHEGQAPHSGEKKEGHSESGGGGIGDYAKMAQGFLKK